MKKLKLNGKLILNKQTIATLNDSQMNSINGGGEANSNRKTGDCRFSRNHPSYQQNGSCQK